MRASALLAFVLLVSSVGACVTQSVFRLDVGTCYDNPPSGETEVGTIPVVDCSEAHDNEVYYVFDLPDGNYPGSTAIREVAADRCLEAFEPFVGIAYADSTLDVAWFVPTPGSWDGRRDREVACSVFAVDRSKLTGSAAGSGI